MPYVEVLLAPSSVSQLSFSTLIRNDCNYWHYTKPYVESDGQKTQYFYAALKQPRRVQSPFNQTIQIIRRQLVLG